MKTNVGKKRGKKKKNKTKINDKIATKKNPKQKKNTQKNYNTFPTRFKVYVNNYVLYSRQDGYYYLNFFRLEILLKYNLNPNHKKTICFICRNGFKEIPKTLLKKILRLDHAYPFTRIPVLIL